MPSIVRAGQARNGLLCRLHAPGYGRGSHKVYALQAAILHMLPVSEIFRCLCCSGLHADEAGVYAQAHAPAYTNYS